MHIETTVVDVPRTVRALRKIKKRDLTVKVVSRFRLHEYKINGRSITAKVMKAGNKYKYYFYLPHSQDFKILTGELTKVQYGFLSKNYDVDLDLKELPF